MDYYMASSDKLTRLCQPKANWPSIEALLEAYSSYNEGFSLLFLYIFNSYF